MVMMALEYGLPQLTLHIKAQQQFRNETLTALRREGSGCSGLYPYPWCAYITDRLTGILDDGTQQRSFSSFASDESTSGRGPRLVLVTQASNKARLAGINVSQSSLPVGFAGTVSEMGLRAVDGNIDGSVDNATLNSVAMTGEEREPWWEVDLGISQAVGSIAIWSQQQTSQHLGNVTYTALWVFLSGEPFGNMTLADSQLKGCPYMCPAARRFTSPKRVLLWAAQTSGRYLRVQLENNNQSTAALMLVEVQVFGPTINVAQGRRDDVITSSPLGLHGARGKKYLNKRTHRLHPAGARLSGLHGTVNLALAKPANQSSTYPASAVASLAVNGNTNGKWDSTLPDPPYTTITNQVRSEAAFGSVDTFIPFAATSRTQVEYQPWWSVDLGQQLPVGRIIVLNRQDGNRDGKSPRWHPYDCCEEMLFPFRVMLVQDQANFSRFPYSRETPLSVVCADSAVECQQFSTVSARAEWNVYGVGRYVRIQIEDATASLMLTEVEVYLWGPATRYMLVELRGDGRQPFSLADISVLGTNRLQPLSVSVHSQSTSVSAATNAIVDGDGSTCLLSTSPHQREWVVLDLGEVTPVTALRIKNPAGCGTATAPASRIAVSLYVTPQRSVLLPCNNTSTDPCYTTPAFSTVSAPSSTVYDQAEPLCNCTLPRASDGLGRYYADPSGICPCGGDLYCVTPQCLLLYGAQGSNAYLPFRDFEPALLLSDIQVGDQLVSLVSWDYADVVLQDDPVGYWRLDDQTVNMINLGSGGLSVAAQLSNVGMAQPPPLLVDDEYVSIGVTFDGASDKVTVSGKTYQMASDESFTHEFRVRPNALVESCCVLSAASDVQPASTTIPAGFHLKISSNLTWQVFVGNDDHHFILEGAPVHPSRWAHLAVSYDGSSRMLTLSTNCARDNSNASASTFQTTHTSTIPLLALSSAGLSSTLQIGAGCGASSFVGDIAELAIYSVALSNVQALDHFMFSEAHGTAGSYEIELQTEPLSDVTVTVNTESACIKPGLCNVTAFPATLTFTSSNWNQSQTVVVTAIDDPYAEPLIHYTSITHQVSSRETLKLVSDLLVDARIGRDVQTRDAMSVTIAEIQQLQRRNDKTLDAQLQTLIKVVQNQSSSWQKQQVSEKFMSYNQYDGIAVKDVVSSVADDDQAAVLLTTSVVVVEEGAYGDGYSVVLSTEPSSPVTVSIRANLGCFRDCRCGTCVAAGASAGAATLDAGVCSAMNTKPNGLPYYAPASGYDYSYEHHATAYVLCNVTVSASQLIFSPQNWSLVQNILVSAVDDFLDEATPHFSTIMHTVTSADPVFNSLMIPNITANITDNDFSAVVLTSSACSSGACDTETRLTLTLREGVLDASNARIAGIFDGTNYDTKVGPSSDIYAPEEKQEKSDTYTVRLKSEPFSAVTISVHSDLYDGCYRSCGYPKDSAKCGGLGQRVHEVQTIQTTAAAIKEQQTISVSAPIKEEVQELYQLADLGSEIMTLELFGDRWNEVQEIKTQADPSGTLAGTFKLTFSGNTTASIPWNAPASTIKAALQALWSIGSVDVSEPKDHAVVAGVGQLQGKIWTVTFTGNAKSAEGGYNDFLAAWSGNELGGVDTSLTGSCSGNGCDTAGSNISPNKNLLVIGRTVAGEAMSGNFKINFNRETTNSLDVKASASNVEAALLALDSISAVAVSRSPFPNRGGGYTWSITFAIVAYDVVIANDLGVPKTNLTADTSSVIPASSVLNKLINSTVTEVQAWNLVRGSFNLRFPTSSNASGAFLESAPLPWNATNEDMKTVLEAIDEIGQVAVDRSDASWNPGLGHFTWTITFQENLGDLPQSEVFCGTLTGTGIVCTASTSQQGNTVGGSFSVSVEGDFIHSYGRQWQNSSHDVLDYYDRMPYAAPSANTTSDPRRPSAMQAESGETYSVFQPKVTTAYLNYNAAAKEVEDAIYGLNFTGRVSVTRTPWAGSTTKLLCGRDGFEKRRPTPNQFSTVYPFATRCRGFTFTFLFVNTVGNVPELTADSSQLTGSILTTLPPIYATAAVTTIMDGNYISGNFTVTVNGNIGGTVTSATTWALPYNVSAAGMRQAIEALSMISQRREDAFNRPKYGVVVTRAGPDEQGGYIWRIVWSIVDTTLLMANLITLDITKLHAETSSSYVNKTVSADRVLCNLTVTPSTMTFTKFNWNQPQTVTVTPINDELDEGTRNVQPLSLVGKRYRTPYAIAKIPTVQNLPTSYFSDEHRVNIAHTASSDDRRYDQIYIANITAVIEDDDTSFIYVSKSNVTVVEGGKTDSYTLQLETEPRHEVTILIQNWANCGIDCYHPEDCYRWNLCNSSVTPESLIFTPKNWYEVQTVSVEAVDDDLDEHDIHRSLLQHAVYSDDIRYHSLAVHDVIVYITDNDVSAVNISKSSVVVREASLADNYTVLLNSEPWAKVTVDVNGGYERGNRLLVGAEGADLVDSIKLTFTYRNWNQPQTVHVQAFDDELDDNDPHIGRLHHRVLGKDFIYHDIKIVDIATNTSRQNVTAEIYDNDISGASITPNNPINTSNTVYVKEGWTQESKELLYNNYTVSLNTEPWYNVTIDVVTSGVAAGCYRVDLCNVTANPASLTFSPDNWNLPQIVTLVAVDDHLDEYNPHFAPVDHITTSADSKYQVVQLPALTAHIVDNDISGVKACHKLTDGCDNQLTVAEGAFSDSYTIVLETEPYADVTVTLDTPFYDLMDSNNANITDRKRQVFFGGATLSYTKWLVEPVEGDIFFVTGTKMPVEQMRNYTVFTPLNWSIPQTVQVYATDDEITEAGTHHTQVTHSAASSDPYYNQTAQIVSPVGMGANRTTGLMSIATMEVTISEQDKEPPPKMQAAEFSHSAAQIFVDFDSMAYHEARVRVDSEIQSGATIAVFKMMQGSFNCSLIFQEVKEGKLLLGDPFPSTTCMWVGVRSLAFDVRSQQQWYGGKRVVITLGRNAIIKPGDKITLNRCTQEVNGACESTDVIKARGWSQLASQGSIGVTVPGDQPPSEAILSGPQRIGTCSDLVLDGSASNGFGGGRPVQYTWYVLEGTQFAKPAANESVLGYQARVRQELADLRSQIKRDCTDEWYKIPRCSAEVENNCIFEQYEPIPTRKMTYSLRTLCALTAVANQSTVQNHQMLGVAKGVIGPGSVYTFLMSAETFLLQTASVTHVVQSETTEIPLVQIVGDIERSIHRNQDVWFQTNTIISCPKKTGTGVKYRWEQIAGDLNMTGNPIFSRQLNKIQFNLPKSSTTSGMTYKFRFWVTFEKTPFGRSYADVQVQVESADIAASVGSIERSLGAMQQLVLDASTSHDPDGSLLPLNLDIACNDVATGSPCLDVGTGQPLFIDKSEKTVESGGLKLRTTGLTGLVKNGTFAPNSQARFALTVSKQCPECQYENSITRSSQRDADGRCPPKPEPPGIPISPIREICTANPRNTTVYVSVKITEANGPDVTIRPLQSTIVPTSRELQLVGNVQSSNPPLTYLWSQEEGDLDMGLMNEADFKHPAFLVPLNQIAVSIRANFLTAGSTYSFRLSSRDGSGTVGFAQITVKVNGAPTSGVLVVQPKTGIVLETPYVMEMKQWVDDAADLPLVYTFSVIIGGDAIGTDELALVANLQTNTYSAALEGSSNNQIGVVGYVRDQYESTARTSTNIIVKGKTFAGSDEAIGYIRNQTGRRLNSALESGDPAAINNLCRSLSYILNGAGSRSASRIGGGDGCPGYADSGTEVRVCSGHGQCNPVFRDNANIGVCQCDEGWTSSSCGISSSQMQERKILRGSFIEAVSIANEGNDNSQLALSQTASSLAAIVSAPEELSVESQDTAVGILSSATSTSTAAENGDGAFAGFAESTSNCVSSLFEASSIEQNVVGVLATGRRRLASANDNCGVDWLSSLQKKQRFESVYGIMLSVSATSSRSLLIGQAPVDLSTSNNVMRSERLALVDGQLVADTALAPSSTAGSSYELPKELLAGVPFTSPLFSTVIEWVIDPHHWSNSSCDSTLITNVLSLSLHDAASSSPLEISANSQPIRARLPNKWVNTNPNKTLVCNVWNANLNIWCPEYSAQRTDIQKRCPVQKTCSLNKYLTHTNMTVCDCSHLVKLDVVVMLLDNVVDLEVKLGKPLDIDLTESKLASVTVPSATMTMIYFLWAIGVVLSIHFDTVAQHRHEKEHMGKMVRAQNTVWKSKHQEASVVAAFW
jgi:hypothetical protein